MTSITHLRAVTKKPEGDSGFIAKPDVAETAKAPASSPSTNEVPPVQEVAKEPGFFLKTSKKFVSNVMPPLVMLFLFVGLWEILCSTPDSSLPSFSRTISETSELIMHPFYDNGGNDVGLGWQILASLKRVAYGYSLAVFVGIAIGVLIGQFSLAMKGLDPIFQVLRTVPPLAWLPLSLAGFQDSHPSAIFVIFITAIWPIIINTSVGVRNIPEDYRNVARVIHLKRFGYFWKIMLPAAAPYIFSGLRIGVGLSWLAIVAAEMLVGGVGIGFFIWDAWNSSLISDIIIALIYVGIVGFMLDRLVAYFGQVITRGTSAG
ncbi:nitrate ABC transporter permease [Saccharophagus sp. K07]|uniref:nitrate ABC transporter permease n=1 Tax=Saccharophagus sp. K07 TaxID=2283636 RepID=UPI002103E615|nr:nitrate ABC transporter permease [Saccharophagus sp. K07]